MQDTYVDQGLFIFLVQMLRTVSILLLTLNWSEHFIWCVCFQICSGNNNLSLLHAFEVISLINKGATSPYVQEWIGILLKFNDIFLHCTGIECQPF